MPHSVPSNHTQQKADWSDLIPEAEWDLYESVIDEATARCIPFALGGAFALAAYTGAWRNTKDLDLYVLPQNRERMIDVLSSTGLTDYFQVKPYDRWWIYRGHRGECIVDIIWAMANHRAEIDDLWMSGPSVELRGRWLRILPAEAMLWDKLYIMQRDRCDWPDVLNLLYSVGPDVDWKYLLQRMGDDSALMAAALAVFRWVAPGRAQDLPAWIWEDLRLPAAASSTERPAEIDERRVSLLDTRPWFGPDRQNLQPAA